MFTIPVRKCLTFLYHCFFIAVGQEVKIISNSVVVPEQEHARIQEFVSGGGGGVQVNLTKKTLNFFFRFFSPQLILQKSNG